MRSLGSYYAFQNVLDMRCCWLFAFKRCSSAGRRSPFLLAEMSSLVSLISLLVTKSSCPYITLVKGYSLRTEIYPPSPECIKVPHLPQVHASPPHHHPHHHVAQPTHGGAGGWVGGMAVVCGGEPQPFAMTSECFGYSLQVHALFPVRL